MTSLCHFERMRIDRYLGHQCRVVTSPMHLGLELELVHPRGADLRSQLDLPGVDGGVRLAWGD